MDSQQPLLDVRDLTVRYRSRHRGGHFNAVDGVSLTVGSGETVGLVGESGSGKTSIGRAILGLTQPQAGTIRFDGRDITSAGPRERRSLSKSLQVIFQDPYGSLNPALTVGRSLSEPLQVHERIDRRAAASRVAEMLERVGLPEAAARRYPREFSGGQRQRIAIARALMMSPRLIICDEPCSALDLSVQAQILNLLADLQRTLQVSYLFISHDLSVVRYVANRLVVLYRGKVVEAGPAAAIYDQPQDPYTRKLMAATPTLSGPATAA